MVSRRRQRPGGGYALVALVVILAVMNVLVAAALPYWSQVMRRDREAELIFRGLQYAEAIRVFQLRFNRLPNTLDELIEVNPRSIRRLWADPMTDSGEWDLVRGETVRGDGGGQDLARGTGAGGRDAGREERRGRNRANAPGPIMGVQSKSDESGLREFKGTSEYAKWQFTVELIPVPNVIPDTLLVPRPTSEYVGRGFRDGIEPLQGSGAGQDLGRRQRPPADDG
jgi:type II secretory pathway pseudopilin PulG